MWGSIRGSVDFGRGDNRKVFKAVWVNFKIIINHHSTTDIKKSCDWLVSSTVETWFGNKWSLWFGSWCVLSVYGIGVPRNTIVPVNLPADQTVQSWERKCDLRVIVVYYYVINIVITLLSHGYPSYFTAFEGSLALLFLFFLSWSPIWFSSRE